MSTIIEEYRWRSEQHKIRAKTYGEFHVTEHMKRQKKLAKLASEAANALEQYNNALHQS